MAFLARAWQAAPGMGAAGLGNAPGLSPRVLAMIEGLKQNQMAQDERRMQFEQQMAAQAEDRAFRRQMADREFGLRERELGTKSKRELAGIVTPLMKQYNDEVQRILSDPNMSSQQKMVSIGRARNSFSAIMQSFGVDEGLISKAVGGGQSIDDLQKEVSNAPIAYDPEATQSLVRGLSEAPTARGMLSLAGTGARGADPVEAARAVQQAFAPGGKFQESIQLPGSDQAGIDLSTVRSGMFQTGDGVRPEDVARRKLAVIAQQQRDTASRPAWQQLADWFERSTPDVGAAAALRSAGQQFFNAFPTLKSKRTKSLEQRTNAMRTKGLERRTNAMR